jgi:Secretion system C-terminal sorting domain
MIKSYSILIAAFFAGSCLQAQTFWTESFSNGCTAACLANAYTGPNGAWTQTVTGTEGADPNTWYISCSENGNPLTACGSTCGGNPNPTLHIGPKIGNPFCPNDCGAVYDAGGLCGVISCPETSRRIESPVIDCSNANSSIAVSFNYLGAGAAPNDLCNFWYYDGITWTLIQAIPPTNNIGCAGQGRWTGITIPLPSSAMGNANVKIGFEWKNNDDGAGTDPSIAIDEITVNIGLGADQHSVLSSEIKYDASSDQIAVHLQNENVNGTTVEIYSMDGKLISSESLTTKDERISVAGLASGLYIVKLNSKEGAFLTMKFVVD